MFAESKYRMIEQFMLYDSEHWTCYDPKGKGSENQVNDHSNQLIRANFNVPFFLFDR